MDSFITHYSKGTPFLSLTGISEDERKKIVSSFSEDNVWSSERYTDPQYINKRIVVEETLLNEFIRIGGRPELRNPIYFTLGRNLKFEERHGPKLKRYSFNIHDIPSNCLSFTYGDSLLAFDAEYRMQVPGYDHSLCRVLYPISELTNITTHLLLPKENPLRIEVQVWADPNQFELI